MAKHDKVLKKIFENPVPANIPWRDIESLMLHHGAEITEGNGSRVRVALNDEKAVFHRPHPEKETDRGAVKSVREFLENAGIRP
ncbi:MAG: type II toxin-antitoxin system HicA family toxin [Planctomycetaceae bacterium]|nr:type II toxin-antitoxin system HicA family toxin [Planctomycetaceae bacterium]